MVLRWFAALAVLPALSSTVLCQSYSATELYAFKAYGTGDANIPSPALIQASDGNYYGASYFGGMNTNAGAIFRITPTGEESVVYGFCAQANCADGYMPSSLVEASDGNLYGTTIEYNKIDNTTYVGHIFRVNPISGAYTTLHAFTTVEPYYGGPVNIMQGSDGNLYGTTGSGSSLGVHLEPDARRYVHDALLCNQQLQYGRRLAARSFGRLVVRRKHSGRRRHIFHPQGRVVLREPVFLLSGKVLHGRRRADIQSC